MNKPRHKLLLGCGLFTMALSTQLHAGEDEEIEKIFNLSIEELFNIVVEVATKTREKSSLSPAIMTVITDLDIANYGYQSVSEALQHVAGLVDNHDLAMHNFGVRGINSGVRSGSRTIKFMIDGQAVAFRATSQNFIGKELIPMDLVERIEVIRGPASALYGANAFLGVVNVVTKSGEKLKNQGSAVAVRYNNINAAGDGYDIALSTGNKKDNWRYAFGVSTGSDDRTGIALPRRSPAYARFDNHQSIRDKSEPLSAYFKSDYRMVDGHRLGFSLHYQQLDVDNPFSDINALQNTGHSHVGLENLFARLDYDIEIGSRVNAHLFATYSNGDTMGSDRVEVGADSFYLDRRIGFDGVDFGAEMFIKFRENDTLLLGFDTKRDSQKLESFTRVDRITNERMPLNPNRDKAFTDTGVYLQYVAQINQDWKGVLGYRIDDDSVIGQQSSARIGVVGQLPHDIVLKVLAGSAFQAPSPELLYRDAVQAGDIIGNPDLDAQKASTVELSIAAPVNEYWHLSATYFDTTVDDLVVFESDASNLFAKNTVGSQTKGFEFEARLLWQGVNSYFNFTHQNTSRERNPLSLYVLEYRPDGELFPENMANLGISYQWEKWRLSWQTRWVGAREASTQNVLVANQFYRLGSYSTSNLSISTKAFSLLDGKEATLRFQLTDVFDNKHVDPGFGGIDFPSLGQRYSVTFEQRF